MHLSLSLLSVCLWRGRVGRPWISGWCIPAFTRQNVTSSDKNTHTISTALPVEAGFYNDTGRVVGSFTKLSDRDRGKYLNELQIV